MRERAHRFGPLPFDEFVELALYAPGAGFYESGDVAFTTSPEVGPLFGAVLARALDDWWVGLGSPDPFVVVEAAAGRGALCKAVLDASPACSSALRYLMVERSELLRAQQPTLVPVERAADVLGPVAPADEETDDGARVLPGRGPRIAALPELPAGPLTGVVFANELLDNLPFAIVEWSGTEWLEVRVTAELTEALVPAGELFAEEATRLVVAPGTGARIPLQRRATEWLRSACEVLDRGRVVVIDYAVDTTASLAAGDRPWLRTYLGGFPGGDALSRPGEQDITSDVCIDQLARVRVPAMTRTQAEFLEAYGMPELVEAARATWDAAAASPTLDALAARSRVSEAAALADASGLGAFRVIEWDLP